MQTERNPGKQNFVLFFEEQNDDRCISQNLVKLYLNRFVIDEMAQHEVIGVFKLESIPAGYIPEQLMESIKTNKLQYDKKIFKTALRKSLKKICHSEPFSIHFMIGSEIINEKLQHWMSKWLHGTIEKNLFVICTQIRGIQCWISQNVTDFYNTLFVLNENRNDNDKVTDDLEYMTSCLTLTTPYELLFQRVALAFHRMLSEHELDKTIFYRYPRHGNIRERKLRYVKPEYVQLTTDFIACLSKRGPILPSIGQDLHSITLFPFNQTDLPLISDEKPDDTYKYLHCDCERLSFICWYSVLSPK